MECLEGIPLAALLSFDFLPHGFLPVRRLTEYTGRTVPRVQTL